MDEADDLRSRLAASGADFSALRRQDISVSALARGGPVMGSSTIW
jgi:hypothetical protein